MNCPVCKNVGLNAVTLESDLPACNCPKCGGNWIGATQYWSWLEAHKPGGPATDTPVTVSDSKGAKLCPECGGILIRHQVGSELGFAAEQCGRCKGFWLDKNEWETLKAHELHDELHLIMSGEWRQQIRREEYQRKVEQQRQMASEEYKRQMQEHYTQRFGTKVYAEARRVRAWLAGQSQRLALLAYLCDTDPYRERGENQAE